MRALLLLALLALSSLNACGPVAQNAQEFRDVIGAHRRGRIETWRVADPQARVVERLETAFRYCVDREEITCNQGCTKMTHIHLREPSEDGRVTLSVRLLVNGRVSRRGPPEGLYEMVVDIDRAGSATEVSWYGTNHQFVDPYVQATKRWSEHIDHPVSCPEFRETRMRDLRAAPEGTEGASAEPPSEEPARSSLRGAGEARGEAAPQQRPRELGAR